MEFRKREKVEYESVFPKELGNRNKRGNFSL